MKFPAQYTINWQEQFRMMKRWYYRLRGENDLFGLKISHREDFFLSFFVICEHFRERLIKEDIATKEEIEALTSEHRELSLCREVANSFKHVSLDSRHVDPKTNISIKKLQITAPDGCSYLESFLSINSPTFGVEKIDAFELVERCMDIWGNFLITKSLEIPCMPEENILKYFNKWEPTDYKQEVSE